MLLVLAFGMLVAATLMAASPVYTRVMNDLGLESSLEAQIGSATRNGLVRFGLPLGSEEAATESRRMVDLAAREIGWFTGSEVRGATLAPITLGREGQPVPAGQFRPLVTLQTLSGFEDQVRVLDGRLPRPTDNPDEVEAVISAEAAGIAGVKPGDRMLAAVSFDDCNRPPPTQDPVEAQARARFPCVPQAQLTMTVAFTVAGIVEAVDATASFWSAGFFSFGRPPLPENEGPTIPVLLPEHTLFQAVPKALPRLRVDYRHTSFADISKIDYGNIDDARQSLAQLREQAEGSGLIPDLAMAGPLQSFNQRASFNQVTLLILLLQVVGIAVYYVLLVSSLLAERRAEEVAMLRSRGATVLQVVAIAAVEAAILGGLAALAAPFLASGIVALLGKTGTFEEVSAGKFLNFLVLPEAFLYAFAGAAIAVLAVIVPSFFAARGGMVLFLRGAARPGESLIQRYYIDFALAALAGLALWELNQRGSVFDPRSVGGWSADPLLLLSPLLLILAVGSLLFRYLPLVLGIIARVVAMSAGPGTTLGLWQLTRSPARYTQLALLVVMAASVGTFAATYSATTDRSQEERALFTAGTDLRTTGLGELDRAPPAEVRDALDSVPGVEASAAALRASLPLGPTPALQDSVQVLGIDPSVAPSLLWFRPDFADEGIEGLSRRLLGSPASGAGIALPGEPVSIGLWAGLSAPRQQTTMWLRTVDGRGVFRLHELGQLDFTGYQYFQAPLQRAQDGIQFPVSLLGVILTQSQNVNDPSRGNLYFDDITVTDADGAETVIEDFEGPFRWNAVRTATRNRDTASLTNQNQRRGNGAAQLSLLVGQGVSVRGLLVGDPNIPLPAIVSSRLLERTGIAPGGELELVIGTVAVPLSVQASADLFPTLDDSAAGFVVVNQDHLFFYAELLNQSSQRLPNEAWLRLSGDDAQRAATMREIELRYGILSSQMIDVQKTLEEADADPIVRAGGSGVLLIALIAAFAILAIGFALTLYLGGQSRTLEVSVLRAVGLSARQIFLMIGLEYLVVAGIGLVVGTIAGLRISETMLSFLNVTEDGNRVVPPFELVTSWGTVGVAFAATAIAFAIGVVALALYFLRLPVSRVLRLTR
jgi:hypothetical protein